MSDPWLLLVLAAAVVVAEAVLQRRTGLNLADEGYLWYGAWRTSAGETPMESFRSYDPGRLYWCAPWLAVFGRGILAVRAAVSAFTILGLWAALAVATRATEAWFELLAIAALLQVWAHPRWKRFEAALSLVAVLVVTWILEEPTAATLFIAGLLAGLAAFFGRNHGVYHVAGQLGALLYLWLHGDRAATAAAIGAWVLGGIVGYAPMWVRWVVGGGDALRFYVREKLLVFVRRRSTNLAVQPTSESPTISQSSSSPSTSPGWAGDGTRLGMRRGARRVADALHRVLLVVAPALLAGAVVWAAADEPGPPTWLLAVALAGLPYCHHAFARADVSHLAQALGPFWLGIGMSLSRLEIGPAAVGVWAAVAVLSAMTLWPLIPACHRAVSGTPYETVTCAGQRLHLPAYEARLVGAAESLVDRAAAPSGAVFVAPDLPGLYVVLGRRSPVHDTYLLFAKPVEQQQEMIEQLTDVRVALLRQPDGRSPSPPFEDTHPLVWADLHRRLVPTDVPGLPPDVLALTAPAS